jgi:hypothetical protein
MAAPPYLMVSCAGSTVEKSCNGEYSVTRTLEDTLVAAIQRAPCQPLAKLALADLLEERGNSLEARSLRWCAENRKWPQRRGYVREYKVIASRGDRPTGYLWQWWHFSVDTTRRSFKGRWRLRPVLSAIIPEDIGACWSISGTWGHPTWFTALTALGLALKQLEEESDANDQDEGSTFSAVGRSL